MNSDRTHRLRTDDDIARIADAHHAWRGDGEGASADGPGFCKAAAAHDHMPPPGRYVGLPELEDDGKPFDEKIKRLVAELREQQARRRSAMPPSPPT